MECHGTDPGRLIEWIGTYKRQILEVQDLQQIAPGCAEFPDLLSTIKQAIDTAEAELEGPTDKWDRSLESGFTVDCDPLPLDLSSCSPNTVAKHITAIQQRAAVLGTGPHGWAIGANCQARTGPGQQWKKAVIEGISSAGKFLVDWLPSARETCFEVERSDLKLVPPIAGAFWTPQQPPPYDKSLPAYPVTYSEEEKAAQRQAYDEHLQGLKDAMAAQQSSYTFPPGVYRSRETMHIEDTRHFTLTMANVEFIVEDKGFLSLRNNENITVGGPLVLDAEPFKVSQCEITGSDAETYLELRVMPGYGDPSTQGKLVFYGPTGKSLPTGQVWCEKCESLGDGCFRMEFDWGNRYVLRIPGVPKVGNFITQGTGADGIALSCDTNVTFKNWRAHCGGDVWGLQCGVCTFTNLRAMRRPGTSRLFAGGRFYQVWFNEGSFIMDRCEVAQNDDDLSDVFTWMGYASDNAGSDSSIFALAWGGVGWRPGHPLCIYNCRTLELVGKARIKAVGPSEDKSGLEKLSAAMKAAGKGEASADCFTLIELDQPVKLPGLCIIDDLVTKPDRISFTNCYFHDGLDAGIVGKGALDSLVANCVVERIAYTGIETSCGGEGAFAGNVVVRNNTVRDAWHRWSDLSPSGGPGFLGGSSIAVTAASAAVDKKPSGCPIKSASVVGNLVINPHGKPIEVSQCKSTIICGNLPADPLQSDALDDIATA